MTQFRSVLAARRLARQIYTDDENITLMESTPLLLMHLACLAVFWVGFSWTALAVFLLTYAFRVFALTAGFHRYFSHRSYKTSRAFQFILGFLGTSAAQLGPIWWASHHRHHHEYSDTPRDIHSPGLKGFFFAHIGWIMCRKYASTETERVGDLLRYPELRWLDRFLAAPPLLLAAGLYGLGHYLFRAAPGLGTSGWQMVVWGFFISTTLVYHVTFCINSVTHMYGNRRFNTRDESRNSFLLAFLTMGEGWHNNHHRYPISARQGLYWWELDVTYYLLRLLEKARLVWGLQVHPASIYREAARLKEQREQEARAPAIDQPPIVAEPDALV
jgi:stearoyl-CoA desaturase (delta-9 desaturase)